MDTALLLNPPGSRPYIRDGYCSLVGRRGYAFHPLDLLVQSGYLARAGYRVAVIDAIAEGASGGAVLARVRALSPRAVLVLGGEAASREDGVFLDGLRAACPKARLVGSGDLFQFDPRGALARHPALDAVLADFACEDLVRWLSGHRDSAPQVIDRGPQGPVARRQGRFSLPRPLHRLFPRRRYRLPYHARPFASVLTSYGCPYGCTFCNTSQIPYKLRDADEVLDEVEWLVEGEGYDHVYFRDATLGVSRPHLVALCEGILARRLRLTWNSFTRADLLDPDLLRAMARAGCTLLQLGLESDDDARLDEHHKGLTAARARSAVRACRDAGIAVCGHFIVSWPGRPAGEGAARVARFAAEIGCTYASFNVAEPRPGTPFRTAFPPGEGPAQAEARGGPARATAMRRFYLDPRTARRVIGTLAGPRDAWHAARLAGAALSGA